MKAQIQRQAVNMQRLKDSQTTTERAKGPIKSLPQELDLMPPERADFKVAPYISISVDSAVIYFVTPESRRPRLHMNFWLCVTQI